MIRITTYISAQQDAYLKKKSYQGKKKDKPADAMTFSEHLRKAIDAYAKGLK